MAYCADENESDIPSSLCNNACMASCYTGSGRRRRDVGKNKIILINFVFFLLNYIQLF